MSNSLTANEKGPWSRYYKCLEKVPHREIVSEGEKGIFHALAEDILFDNLEIPRMAEIHQNLMTHALYLSAEEIIEILGSSDHARTQTALIVASRMIYRRLHLKDDVERSAIEGHRGWLAHVQQEVADFARDPFLTRHIAVSAGQLRHSEKSFARFLRGSDLYDMKSELAPRMVNRGVLHELADRHKAPDRGHREIFLAIDVRATDQQIRSAVEALVKQARMDHEIKAGELPSIGEKRQMLRTLERMLAVFDWKLLRDCGIVHDGFKDLAQGVYSTSGEDAPERKLKMLCEANFEKMMCYGYAKDLYHLVLP